MQEPPKMSPRRLEHFYFMQVAQKRIEWEIPACAGMTGG